MSEINACYVIRGVNNLGEQRLTRRIIWPNSDRIQLRLTCQQYARNLNDAGATMVVSYQEINENGLWKDVDE